MRMPCCRTLRNVALRHSEDMGAGTGPDDAAGLLQTTLDEEQATDFALTSIATSVVNRNAE